MPSSACSRPAPTRCGRSPSFRAEWRSASPSRRPTSTASTTTGRELLAKIKVALGGRAAEEIVYGEPTTGAESDIQQLTQIARQMVGRWGMSDRLGPLTLIPSDGSGPLLPGASEVSPRTQELIDEEVRRIVEAAYKEVLNLLTENRGRLDSLAAALVEHETLDEDDAYAAAGVPHEGRPADAKGALAAASIVAATKR